MRGAVTALGLLVAFLAPAELSAHGANHYTTVHVVSVEKLNLSRDMAHWDPSGCPNHNWCPPLTVEGVALPPLFLVKAIVAGQKFLLQCQGRSSHDCNLEYPADYEGELKSNGTVLLYVSVDGGKPHNVKYRILGPW